MAPDPRLDETSLSREAEAASARRAFPRPEIDRFGSTPVGLTEGGMLGSLAGALAGAVVGFTVALLFVDGLVPALVLPLVGALLGAGMESLFNGTRTAEHRRQARSRAVRRDRATRPTAAGGSPAMREG